MKCIRMDVNLYEGAGARLEVELLGYDSERTEPWASLDLWSFEAGEPFLLGEGLSHFEMLADALGRSMGLQLALPFE